MTVGRISSREVDTADADEPIQAAGQRMGSRMVGTLVVLDAARHPIGILTDRDLAVRAVGRGLDPDTAKVADVMTREVQTAFEEMPIEDALSLMRSQTIRRLPVVARSGELLGIVSLDDVLTLLSEEFNELGRLLAREQPRSLATTDR